MGIDHTTAAKAWSEYAVMPWREGTCTVPPDPDLVAKVVDVVGLGRPPPENAVLLCMDREASIQILERTAASLPMQPGEPVRAHDDLRRGTSTLFAALETAPGL